MRLLNTYTLKLEEFLSDPPTYAILSHTWEDGEVLFEDFKQGTEQQKRGYGKIKDFCKYACHRYVWVDTCCIDKSSSAELSEAINSMFNWYRYAEVCFVYLNIKTGPELSTDELQSSRWISRGWCLQELIAPSNVKFFNQDWEMCGTRQQLATKLHQVTNIEFKLLDREVYHKLDLESFSIAKRMSWADNRKTTRPEDIAYCLLGLFDVHMPLLYGEGGERAFLRLQEEILKRSQDYSILAWDNTNDHDHQGPIARHPREFQNGAPIVTMNANAQPFEMTNKGLRVTLPLIEIPNSLRVIAVLHNCRYEDNFEGPLGIVLQPLEANVVYCREIGPIEVIPTSIIAKTGMTTIYIRPQMDNWTYAIRSKPFPIWFNMTSSRSLPSFLRGRITVQPPTNGKWNPETHVLRIRPEMREHSHLVLCYKEGETEQPLVKIIVSPILTSDSVDHPVGLCDPLAPVNEVENLPKTMSVWVYGFTIRAAAKAEKKVIMEELVLEVTLDLKSSSIKTPRPSCLQETEKGIDEATWSTKWE